MVVYQCFHPLVSDDFMEERDGLLDLVMVVSAERDSEQAVKTSVVLPFARLANPWDSQAGSIVTCCQLC